MPASCAARATMHVEHRGAGARRDGPSSIAISLKPRPSRITTPGTPPSRTIRLEPAPITVTGISGRQVAQEIGQIVLVLRHEEHLRRAADAEPGQFAERLVGQQTPAQSGMRAFRSADDVGKAITLSAFNSAGSA